MQTQSKTPAKTATATKTPAKKAPAKKPSAKKASPATAAPESTESADKSAEKSAAVISRGLARDAATVSRNATNFAQSSDRDTAYLLFFGSVMRKNGDTATLAQIADAGTPAGKNRRVNPHYTGSAKATDAGAINRLKKAGLITASADGRTLTATSLAKSNAAYNGKA